MVIANNFKKGIFTTILPAITETCGSLQADLMNEPDKKAFEMYNNHIEEMRKVVNRYLDEQKTTFERIRTVF